MFMPNVMCLCRMAFVYAQMSCRFPKDDGCNDVEQYHRNARQCTLDQELISVRALVFDLAQLTCQKRFDCRNPIIRSSETFLDTSLSQIVVAVFVYDIIFIHTVCRKRERQKREKNLHDIRQLLFLQHLSGLICYLNLCNDCRQ